MLLGAGLGSMTSVRCGLARAQRWGLLLPLLLLALNAALAPLFTASLGWPLPLRVAASILLIVPPAFSMGLCFPLGMIRFGDENKAWFWALNGAAGVLASVISLALAMHVGFQTVGYLGVGAYALAWLAIRGKAAIFVTSELDTAIPRAGE